MSAGTDAAGAEAVGPTVASRGGSGPSPVWRWGILGAAPALSMVVGIVALPRPQPVPDLTPVLSTTGGQSSDAGSSLVSRTRPAVPLAVDAELGGQVSVLGADVPRAPVKPGGPLAARFFFEVKRPLTRSWQVFLHIDARAGGYRIHGDHDPVRGSYPTDLWQAGEFITDEWSTTVPRDAPAGTYDVWLGFYSEDTRLEWTRGDGTRHDGNNRVRVGAITVER